MTRSTHQNSELNPTDNITPSVGTTINGILVLLPLTLVLLGFYSGFINL